MAPTGDFRLSITRALGDQLADALKGLEPASLDPFNLAHVDRRSGVYQLYHHDDLVYIGKADASLRDRLAQHRRKISGRRNIQVDDMRFTALYVEEDFSAVAPETLLIQRHSSSISWNKNGFGNKDPGRQRDTSSVKSSHFDAMYPIDLEWDLHIPHGKYNLGVFLGRVKLELPYLFRYEGSGEALNKQPLVFQQNTFVLESDDLAARDIFALLALDLPGWQITALPGYVIMYRESRVYDSSLLVYRH